MDLTILFWRHLFILYFILMKGTQTTGKFQTMNADSQEIIQLKEEVAKLNHILQKMHGENKKKEMKTRYDEIKTQYDKMKTQYDEMKTWQDDIKHCMPQNTGHVNIFPTEQEQSNFATFTATPTERRIYQDGETLLFDDVLTNVGANYNGESSIFTCPVSGYYFITVTVINYPVDGTFGKIAAEISLNGVKSGLDVLIWENTAHHQSTNGGVILCKLGDEITAVASWDSADLTLNHGPWSSFAGWLLSLETIEP